MQDNEEKYLITEVIDKIIYNDLDKLWESKDFMNNTLNYTKEEFIQAFNTIFGERKVRQSKIVGFKIRRKS